MINCDTSNLHHKIKNATVHVLSRTDYTAKGFLEFNIKGQPDQIIPFDDIRVKEREGVSYTEGYGFIDDSLAFTLDKGIEYKGNVIMKAMDENLRFKGYAKLNSQHFKEENWFSINSNVNKNGIHLEFDEPVTTDGLQAVVGIFLATDSFHVYPRILEPLKSKNDLSLFHSKGILKYNPDLNQYILGDSSQVYGQNNTGKMLTYDENTSYIITEGLMDFNNGFQGPSFPLVRLDMAGEMKTSIIQPEELTFNSSINFQLDLPNQIRDQVIQDLQSIDELIEYTLYNSVNNKSFESQLLKLIQDEKKSMTELGKNS